MAATVNPTFDSKSIGGSYGELHTYAQIPCKQEDKKSPRALSANGIRFPFEFLVQFRKDDEKFFLTATFNTIEEWECHMVIKKCQASKFGYSQDYHKGKSHGDQNIRSPSLNRSIKAITVITILLLCGMIPIIYFLADTTVKNRTLSRKYQRLWHELNESKAAMERQRTEIAKMNTRKDCKEFRDIGFQEDGIYTTQLNVNSILRVYCDQNTDGGGWTVIQRRVDSATKFSRDWLSYKKGFGDLRTNFWLGNDYINILTTGDPHELRIDLEDWEGQKRFAKYSTFKVQSENEKYLLTIRGYSGNAGDSTSAKEEGDMDNQMFSTPDRDNDRSIKFHCANKYHSGWWFDQCFTASLNGIYYNSSTMTLPFSGIVWKGFHNNLKYSLKRTEMKIRRIR